MRKKPRMKLAVMLMTRVPQGKLEGIILATY
jgi:hypothetical protein